MTESSPAASRLLIVVGAAIGLVVVLLSYGMVAALPRAPGDWLWNGAISVTSERIVVGGPVFDALVRGLDIAAMPQGVQRYVPALGGAALVLALSVLLWMRRADGVTGVGLAATAGFLPLALTDPSEVLESPRLWGLATLAWGFVLARVLRIRTLGAAVVAGGIVGAGAVLVAGASLGIGALLFAFGCGTVACSSRIERTASGSSSTQQHASHAAVSWSRVFTMVCAAGLVAAALRTTVSHAAGFDALHWWADATPRTEALTSPSLLMLRPYAVEALAAILGLSILLAASTIARVLAILAVLSSLGLAAQAKAMLHAHRQILERDSARLESWTTTRTWSVVPHVLLNVPLHVRPQIVANSGGLAALKRHESLETLDFGKQLHVPLAWTETAPSTIVVRWTANGPVDTTFGELLDLPPVPLAAFAKDATVSRPLSPYAMHAAGTLETAFEDLIETPSNETAQSDRLSATESDDGPTVIECELMRGRRLLAIAPPTRRRTIDEDFLRHGLVASATATTIDVSGATVSSEAPRTGAIVEVAAGKHTIRIARVRDR
ncbi:MAG: hypothetical protein H6833_06775 [Planctomycetes bacterium]|nr:hypothetical protein [Planctomycetota bacterium]